MTFFPQGDINGHKLYTLTAQQIRSERRPDDAEIYGRLELKARFEARYRYAISEGSYGSTYLPGKKPDDPVVEYVSDAAEAENKLTDLESSLTDEESLELNRLYLQYLAQTALDNYSNGKTIFSDAPLSAPEEFAMEGEATGLSGEEIGSVALTMMDIIERDQILSTQLSKLVARYRDAKQSNDDAEIAILKTEIVKVFDTARESNVRNVTWQELCSQIQDDEDLATATKAVSNVPRSLRRTYLVAS